MVLFFVFSLMLIYSNVNSLLVKKMSKCEIFSAIIHMK